MVFSFLRCLNRLYGKGWLCFFCFPAFYGVAQNVGMAGVFGNNMILQRDKPVKFWGTAAPNREFAIEFAGQKKSVQAAADGSWKTEFPSRKAGGPYDVKVVSNQPFSYKHPHNKKPVGERLANAALVKVYRKKNYSLYPLMKAYTIQGSKVFIKFKDADALAVRAGGELKGFAIAGADKKFLWSKAKIVGKDEVIVSQDAVPQPVAVRYAWAASPVEANLVNKDGSPAAPFRTDDWKLFTEGKIDNH